VFFLFDARNMQGARRILELALSTGERIEASGTESGAWEVALILDQLGGRSRLLVLGYAGPEKQDVPASVLEVTSEPLSSTRAVDEFLSLAGDRTDRLRFIEEATVLVRKGSPSNKEGRVAPVPKQQARRVEAMSTARAQTNLEIGPLPTVATVEVGIVDRLHASVDNQTLLQVLVCDDELHILQPGDAVPDMCVNRITRDTKIHATAVYGMMSASSTVTNADDGSGPSGASVNGGVNCPEGLVPGARHLAIAIPEAPECASAEDECLRVADAIRWAVGLPTPKHTNWPPLSSLSIEAARVINVSRTFRCMATVPPASEAALYLRESLRLAIGHECGTLGAVVVVAMENAADRAIMETELSFPCRNGLLVVGACRSNGTSIGSADLAWSPVMSMVAPSNGIRLISVPLPPSEACGTFFGPAASFSAPVVAAAAARVIAAKPTLRATEVARILKDTCSVVSVNPSEVQDRWFALAPDGTMKIDPLPGPIPQEGTPACVGDHCWYSLRFGFGSLNVQRALESVNDQS
jgi:hypothetical protein